MHSRYLTMSARYYPERILVRGAPWSVTNKGESGFGKASYRVKAEYHRPLGILGEVWWGTLSRRENARPLFEGHDRVPSLYPKRSNQALRPGPPHNKPLSN